MKINKDIYLLFLLLTVTSLHAQNLVPNPGFEIFTNCPDASCQWDFVDSWSNVNNITGCGNGVVGNPDFYHTCGNGFFELPNTLNGNVSALAGDGILGITSLVSFSADFREYISVELTQPLTIGETYIVNVPFTNGTFATGLSYGGGGTQLGIHFSTGALAQTGKEPIILTPTYETPSPIFNTSWQTITFSFEATEAATHMTIGNFRNDANTNYQQFETPTGSGYAYYFLDEIEVIEATILPVSFSQVQASLNGKSVLLNWALGSTSSQADFVIERLEGDANFISLGAISSNSQKASFIDKRPKAGRNFYRIGYIQTDGEIVYSQIISAFYQPEVLWEVEQTGKTLTVIPMNSSSYSRIKLISLEGRLIHEHTQENRNPLKIDISHLPMGIYFLRLQSDNAYLVKKIVTSH